MFRNLNEVSYYELCFRKLSTRCHIRWNEIVKIFELDFQFFTLCYQILFQWGWKEIGGPKCSRMRAPWKHKKTCATGTTCAFSFCTVKVHLFERGCHNFDPPLKLTRNAWNVNCDENQFEKAVWNYDPRSKSWTLTVRICPVRVVVSSEFCRNETTECIHIPLWGAPFLGSTHEDSDS